MTTISDGLMTQLLVRPQESWARLDFYQPSVALACQLSNVAPARGDTVLPYNNVTAGSFGNVEEGMTLYVGTTPGAYDWGRIRVRSANGSNIVVGRNSHILWSYGLYLTVVKFFEPWGVFHRIVLPTGTDNPIYYKDDDIVYTDQNTKMDPIVCMGYHQSVPRGESIDWHSSGSYSPVGATLSTYAWTFEGGTPASSAVAHPGNIVYNTPGNYTTKLVITDSNGKTFAGYRHVVAQNLPNPGYRWGVEVLEGSRQAGGWHARIWVRGSVAPPPGSLVIITSEDWYGETKLSIPNRVVFVGYIENGSIQMDYAASRFTFDAYSITAITNGRETYGVALDSVDVGGDTVGDGRDWTRMANITTDKALVHYLRWHTSLLKVADFHPTNDLSLKMFADFTHGPIYQTVQAYLNQNLLADFVADRVGALWCEIDVNFTHIDTRTIVPVHQTLSRRHWRGTPEIEHVTQSPVSYAELGGVQYSGGNSGTFTPYLAGAPGEIPSYLGGPVRLTGLALGSQGQLLQMVGDYYADASSEFPRATFPLSGHYRIYDIAPQEIVPITLQAADTPEGLIWNDKHFLIQGASHTYYANGRMMLTDITMKSETSGQTGTVINIPTEPPDCPGCPPPCVDCGPTGTLTGDLVYAADQHNFGRCENFNSGGPNWLYRTGAVHGKTITMFALDPYSSTGNGYELTRAVITCTDSVYMCTDLNTVSPTWVVKLTSVAVAGVIGKAIVTFNFQSPCYTITENGRLYVGWAMRYTEFDGSSIRTMTGMSITGDAGATWSHYVVKDFLFDDTGRNVRRVVASNRTSGTVWIAHMGNVGDGLLQRSTDYGATWTEILNSSTKVRVNGDFDVSYDVSEDYCIITAPRNMFTYSHDFTAGSPTFTDVSNGYTPQGTYGGATTRIRTNIATANRSDIAALIPAGTTDDNFHVFRSNDGGLTWSTVYTASDNGDLYACALGRWPYNPDIMYLLTGGGIYYTRDNFVTYSLNLGDWNSVMPEPWSVTRPVNIVPCWTI